MGSINVPNLVPGKAYAVQVRAVGSNGAYSDWSETILFTAPQDLTVPLNNSYTTNLTTNGQLVAGGMKFGLKVDNSALKNGIFINTNNYWYDDGNFSIGNGTSGVTWNGTDLNVTGGITATTGKIGGWSIDATSLYYGGTGTAKIYIGTGTWGNANTKFYVEETGKFSLGDGFKWDPTAVTPTLEVNGILRGFIDQTTAAPAVPSNTMGVGKFDVTNTSDSIYGIGLKINTHNYWFADSSPRLKVGDSTNYMSYASGNLTVSGTLFSTTGNIAGFVLDTNGLYYVEAGGTLLPWKNLSAGYADQIQLDVYSGKVKTYRQWITTDGTNDNHSIYSSIEPGELKIGKQTIGTNYRGNTFGNDGINRSVYIANNTSNASYHGINMEGSVIRNYLWSPAALNTGENAYGNTYTYTDTNTSNLYQRIGAIGNDGTSDNKNSYIDFQSIFPKFGIKQVIISGTSTAPVAEYTITENFAIKKSLISTLTSISGTSGATTITVGSPTGLYQGLTVTGTGIGSNAYISSITTNAVTAVVASSPSAGFATYTSTGHTFVAGNVITITGASIAGYNGTFTITSVSKGKITVSNATTGIASFTSGLATANLIELSVANSATVSGTGRFYGAKFTTLSDHFFNTDYITVSDVDSFFNGSYLDQGGNIGTNIVVVPKSLTIAATSGVSGANTIVLANVTNLQVGMGLYGTGVGTGTKITNINTGTNTITVSVVNSGTVSGTITFTLEDTACSGNIEFTSYAVTNKVLTSNVATLTIGAHTFTSGDPIFVSGVDSTFNGRYTVGSTTPNTVSYAKTATNVASTAVSPNGSLTYNYYSLPSVATEKDIIVLYQPKYYITQKSLTSNVATLTTDVSHPLYVGQTVKISDIDATFNGNYTITAVTNTTFSYAKTATNVSTTAVVPYGYAQPYGATSNIDRDNTVITNFQFNPTLVENRRFSINLYSTPTYKKLVSNVATLYFNPTLVTPHCFGVGHIVIVSGVDSVFNGTYTITDTGNDYISYAKTNIDVAYTSISGTPSVYHSSLTNGTYTGFRAVSTNATERYISQIFIKGSNAVIIEGEGTFQVNPSSQFLNDLSVFAPATFTDPVDMYDTLAVSGATTLSDSLNVTSWIKSYGNNVVISDQNSNTVPIRMKTGVTGAVAVTATNGSSTAFTITYGGTAFASQPYVTSTAIVTTNNTTNSVFPFASTTPGTTSAAFRGQRVTGDTTTGISFMWIATNA